MYIRKLPRNIQLPANTCPRYRKGGRFTVENEITKVYATIIGSKGIALYVALKCRAYSKDQCCFPSYPVIMKESGIGNRNTVDKYIKILEKAKLIRVYRKNREVNIYTMLNVLPPDSTGVLDNTSITPVISKYQFCKSASSNSDTVNQRIKSYNKINTFNEKESILEAEDSSIIDIKKNGMDSIWAKMAQLGSPRPDKQGNN